MKISAANMTEAFAASMLIEKKSFAMCHDVYHFQIFVF